MADLRGDTGKMMRRTLTAPVRALIPRNRWVRLALIAIPVILLLGFLQPFLGLFQRGVELVLDVLEPMLQTTVGRIAVLLITILVVGVFLFWVLRARIRDWRASAWLGRHLEGVGVLLDGDAKRAFAKLQKVARYRGSPPEEYPDLQADACLKCARICLDRQDPDSALAWIERAGAPSASELERSIAQLRARCVLAQGEVEPATQLAGIEQGLKRFSNDAVLHRLKRDLLLEMGDELAAADTQGMVAKYAVPGDVAAERQRWLDMLVEGGEHALASGDVAEAEKLAKKARRADKKAPEPGCLLGDVQRARGQHAAAVKSYAETRSRMGLDRIAATLRENPGVIEPRDLLVMCPMKGALLVVAREYARRGERDLAMRAAKLAGRQLGATPTVAAVLADILWLTEGGGAADRIAVDAVQAYLAPPA